MFDDLVNEKDYGKECNDPAPEKVINAKDKIVPDPNAKIRNISTIPSAKKIVSSTNQQQVNHTQNPKQTTPYVPYTVVSGFDLAKLFIANSFDNDNLLKEKYIKIIADMIEYSSLSNGLNIYYSIDRAKMAEMILDEILI